MEIHARFCLRVCILASLFGPFRTPGDCKHYKLEQHFSATLTLLIVCPNILFLDVVIEEI